MYGGLDGSYHRRGGLYKLSSLKWSQLSGESDMHGPMKKGGCGMFWFNKNKVAIIGGYGQPPASLQPGASFIKEKDKRFAAFGEGWTDEVHVFDADKCKQSCTYIHIKLFSAQMYSQVPGLPLPSVVLNLLLCLRSPSPALMSTKALMFGGKEGEQRVSDLYLVDFHTMV